MTPRSRATVLMLVLALVGAGLVQRSEPANAARSGRLVPTTGALFGAWIERDQTTADGIKNTILEREAQIGRRFDIVNHFYAFTRTFPTWQETWDLQMGRIPMISWNGTNTTEIVRGDHDALIRTRARGVAALGAPVFMRWFWEMDGGFNTANSVNPATYIAAWKRVRSIFIAEGATNAVWTWCPTAWGFEQGWAQQWYPGDAEVEWVCADGYNFAPTRPGAQWRTWAATYADAHTFAAAHGKPLMAGEWGALERSAGEKAAWFDEARAAIKTMPQFAAVVAFDEKKWHDDEKLWFNWRVDSTEKSLMAFQRWGRDPFFRTRTPLMLPTVSAADATVWEADAADPIVSIPVTLSAPSPDLVTVQATTAAITNGSTEFVAVNRLVKFNPGVVRVLVDVKIRADLLDEPNERVDLVLSTPTNAVLGDAAGAITVADDDPAAAAPRIAVGNGAIVEGASYDRIVAVTVSLSHDHTTDVSVGWSLTGGTAVRDRDWAGTASGTLLFKPGQNSKTVNVRVLPDHLDEIDETMTITLTNPVGGTIADGSGTVTVVDDD